MHEAEAPGGATASKKGHPLLCNKLHFALPMISKHTCKKRPPDRDTPGGGQAGRRLSVCPRAPFFSPRWARPGFRLCLRGVCPACEGAGVSSGRAGRAGRARPGSTGAHKACKSKVRAQCGPKMKRARKEKKQKKRKHEQKRTRKPSPAMARGARLKLLAAGVVPGRPWRALWLIWLIRDG